MCTRDKLARRISVSHSLNLFGNTFGGNLCPYHNIFTPSQSPCGLAYIICSSRTTFWPLIQARNRALAQHQDNTNLGSNLDTLEKVIQIALEEVHEDNDAEERAEINRHAFYALKGWLRDCNGNPQTWVQSCLWPSLIRSEYLDLFAENDDVALLIFIHWCAIMYRSRKRWFFTSWSKRAALKAIQNLSEDWGELLTWPLETLSVVPDIPLEIQTWHKVVPYRSAGAPNTTASAY